MTTMIIAGLVLISWFALVWFIVRGLRVMNQSRCLHLHPEIAGYEDGIAVFVCRDCGNADMEGVSP